MENIGELLVKYPKFMFHVSGNHNPTSYVEVVCDHELPSQEIRDDIINTIQNNTLDTRVSFKISTSTVEQEMKGLAVEAKYNIDYKNLLGKYAQHVRDCEGIDFIDRLNSYHSDVKFNEAEIEALQQFHKYFWIGD